MYEENSGRGKDVVIAILAVLLVGCGIFIFMGRSGPQPAPAVVSSAPVAVPAEPEPPLPVAAKTEEVKNTAVADLKSARKSIKTKTEALKKAIVAVSRGIAADLTPKAANATSAATADAAPPAALPKAEVPVPPKAVSDLASRPVSEGGLWCPTPGCPCGTDCMYIDTSLPVITKNQDGSWKIKCSGVTDYKGKTTATTNIYKWDGGNIAMVSEFQSAE